MGGKVSKAQRIHASLQQTKPECYHQAHRATVLQSYPTRCSTHPGLVYKPKNSSLVTLLLNSSTQQSQKYSIICTTQSTN